MSYDAERVSVLEDIRAAGAAVTFYADTARGGSLASDVTGYAIESPGDPDVYTALGIIIQNPVTLKVAALGLGVTLSPGVQFSWGGVRYAIKRATPLAPDGDPIMWTIVGAA